MIYNIFDVQGSLCNIPHYKSHGELSTTIDRYGSLRHIDENEVITQIHLTQHSSTRIEIQSL